MPKYDALQFEEVTKVVVKTNDGKNWLCEYDSTGRLIPIRELGAPREDDSSSSSSESEETTPGEAAEKEHDGTPRPFSPSGGEPQIEDPEDTVVADAEQAEIASSLKAYDKYLRENGDDPESILKQLGVTDAPEVAEMMTDNVFRARLSSIMTDNMYDRVTRGKTRGKLDMKRLWKAHVGATNLFTQKQSRKNKEYNVVLLVDESGSMSGPKIEMAADVACFLARAFEGINLNLAIIGYNHFVMVHKDFNETVKDYKMLHNTIRANANSGPAGWNNDYDAMAFAYKLFAKEAKGQNFLIMLSDGAPASSGSIDHVLKHPEDLKPAIDEKKEWAYFKDLSGKEHHFYTDTSSHLTRHQRDERRHLNALVHANAETVDTIGIGIHSDCWQVPNHIREDNLDKLKPVLLKEIQKKIKRG